jgi:phage shock protein E
MLNFEYDSRQAHPMRWACFDVNLIMGNCPMPIHAPRISPTLKTMAQIISLASLVIAVDPGLVRVGSQPLRSAVAQAAEAPTAVPQIRPLDLQKQLKTAPEGILLIDVRTLEEFQAGHLAGAVHVPLAEIVNAGGVAPIREQLADRQLILYCRSGRRSEMAVEKLRSVGITGQSLSGGLIEWRQQVDPTLPLP